MSRSRGTTRSKRTRNGSWSILVAPIDGLYGIESAEDGSVSVWNSGELFGAIDVALFILSSSAGSLV